METGKAIKLDELISDGDTVASLPDLYNEFKHAVDDPEGSFDEIGEVILKDPGLSARLLGLVNSAFYGFTAKIETISHAINMIGLDQLNDLVLSTVIIEKFRNVPVESISMKAYWEHSIATGLAAKHLAAHLERPNVERHFIAGLLHDIGRPFLCMKLPEKMVQAVKLSESKNMDINEAEKRVLGFNHCEAGSQLLTTWGLPEVYGAVTRYHHKPMLATTFKDEVGLIHLADSIVSAETYGCRGEPCVSPFNQRVLGLIDMKKKDVESEVFGFLEEQFQEVLPGVSFPSARA